MKHRMTRYSLTSAASIVMLLAISSPAGAVDAPTPLPVPEPSVATPASPQAAAEITTPATSTLTLPSIQANGAAAIAKRQVTLSGLATKLSAQTKDCGTTAAMQAEIARTSTGLSTLGVALASTTDITAARTLYRQIFFEYRVYALVEPKAGIVQRCATQLSRNDALSAEAIRLQGLIDRAAASGLNTVVAQTAKNSAVATLAGINPIPSQSGATYLVPDRGDKALLAANTAALKSANGQLNDTLRLQRTVNSQLDAVRAALRQDLKTPSTTATPRV
jgi:hypothetical protein